MCGLGIRARVGGEREKMVLVLGIDIGTTSIGVCLVESGVSLYHDSVQHNAYIGQIVPDSTAEQDVPVLIEHTLVLLRQLPDKHIDGIAITGQMHGFVAWDGELNPVTNLITWEDRRLSVEQAQQLDTSLQPGYGCASLMWLRQYKPEQLKGAVSCGTIMGNLTDFFGTLWACHFGFRLFCRATHLQRHNCHDATKCAELWLFQLTPTVDD